MKYDVNTKKLCRSVFEITTVLDFLQFCNIVQAPENGEDLADDIYQMAVDFEDGYEDDGSYMDDITLYATDTLVKQYGNRDIRNIKLPNGWC